MRVKFFHWEQENLSFIQGLCLQIILLSLPFLHHLAFPASLIALLSPILIPFCCSFCTGFQNYRKETSAVPITKLRVPSRCAYMTSWQTKCNCSSTVTSWSIVFSKTFREHKINTLFFFGSMSNAKTTEPMRIVLSEYWGFGFGSFFCKSQYSNIITK